MPPYFTYAGRHEAAPIPGQPALVVRDLFSGYNRQDVLTGVNLTVPVGAQVALIGPNGAGKSTLFKAVAGLLPVRKGEVRIYGRPIGACHHRVAYLPQRSEIDWRFPMSARRLAVTGRYVHRGWLQRPQPEDWRIVDAVLARLKIDDLAQRQIGQLSGGQQQRVMLARALVQGADLLLLDEPLNAVDAETRQIVAAVLAEERAAGKTIVVSTHDLDRLESDYDAVIHLVEGQVTAEPVAAGPVACNRRAWQLPGWWKEQPMFETLLAPFRYSFMQTGLLAVVLVGVPCAVLGAYVVLRRMAFIGDALAHTVLPGLVVAYLVGWSLSGGAIAAGVITAVLIGWLARRQEVREDTAIGIVFTGMFALGILLISTVRSFRDFTHILFGNILGVTHERRAADGGDCRDRIGGAGDLSQRTGTLVSRPDLSAHHRHSGRPSHFFALDPAGLLRGDRHPGGRRGADQCAAGDAGGGGFAAHAPAAAHDGAGCVFCRHCWRDRAVRVILPERLFGRRDRAWPVR